VTRTTTLRRFAALRSFASYLIVKRGIDCSRLMFANLPPVELPKMVVADEAATARVSSSLSRTRDWTALRDRAAILTVASAGPTVSELTAMNVGDVFLAALIPVLRSSTEHARLVDISSETAEAIGNYIEVLPVVPRRDTPLFLNEAGGRMSPRSAQSMFARRRNEACLPQWTTLTSLRNLAGKRRAECGATPSSVASAWGISVAGAAKFFASPWRGNEHSGTRQGRRLAAGLARTSGTRNPIADRPRFRHTNGGRQDG
jgi:integrase